MDKLQELFIILDTDNNGYIDLQELHDWIQHESNINIDADELFNNIDVNGNGRIAPEELADYYKDFSEEELKKVTESLYDRHAARLAAIRLVEEKDEFDIDMPVDSFVPLVPETARDDAVNRSEQREAVHAEMDKHRKEKEGETWYAISCKWWQTWREYVHYELPKLEAAAAAQSDDKEDDDDDGADVARRPRMSRSLSFQYGQHPGPIDNASISGEAEGELRLGLMERYDFVLVEESVWKLLATWYGGGPAYPRKVLAMAKGGTQIDLWPCFLVVVWCDSLTGKPNAKTVKRRVVSRNATVTEFMNEYEKNTRLWVKRRRKSDDDDGGGDDSQPYQWCLLDEDSWSLSLLGAQIVSGDTLLLERKNELNKWPRGDVEVEESVADTDEAAGDSGKVVRSESKRDFRDFQIGDEVDALDKRKRWFTSVLRDVKEKKVFVHFQGWSSYFDEWIERDSPRLAPLNTHTTGPYVSKYQQASWSRAKNMSEQGSPVAVGVVGLKNLGNTCFMNSTLQCLMSCMPLTEYFLEHKHMEEINKSNPLGHMGRVAEEYGTLLNTVYSDKFRVLAPMRFKQTIGEFAPQFSGFQQHDSSELLSFLLDGLHEDLNRVLKKPYTQEVESNGRADEIVSKESWDTYLLRNDSIVVDKLTGLLKSTIVCPIEECGRVSVKFDPYLFLSVPLPVSTKRVIPLVFVPFDGSTPVLYGVTVEKQGTIKEMKKAFSELSNVPEDNVRLMDIYQHKIYRELTNSQSISRIRANDTTYAYEVVVPQIEDADVEKAKKAFERMDVGDIIDARDTSKKWYESAIVDTKDTQVKVHYAGWSSRWDEWHERTSARLAPRSTHSYSQIWEVGCYHTTSRRMTFGVPFVICVQPNSVTKRELKALLVKRCERMIDDEKLAEIDDLSSLITIRRRNANGSNCGGCKKYSCAGCPLEDSDEVVQFSNKVGAMLAIEWADSKLFDRTKGERVVRHESAPKPAAKGGGVDRKLLSDCLQMYTRSEKLSPDDAWYCSNCKEFREAQKKFDVYSVPDVLVIHLKRFSYTKYWREKLDTYIDFPLEGLDMSPFMLGGTDEPVLFDLVGVSNHMGGLHGGHYVASVRKPDGNWYDCNDSRVSRIDPDEVVSKSAYLLFYVRRRDE